ncbi:cysteine proteinase [Punctularia strigosozonata HHB-11173 SS5]|uniref:cysteine proteinase n=1 Tax=Punctularia strigosozonata (strain HHB-11173) TaxID=741275 RepID=UPI000441626F|nr:cysteine proteinase [Punctularia strigosozonata HHB-11173 SS5]EIN14231.1 cysteine proteinase [Punctularia strigosozonata HHB-11173 SS5]
MTQLDDQDSRDSSPSPSKPTGSLNATAQTDQSSIPPTRFYSSTSGPKPPPLPNRPRTSVGTASTQYMAPPSPPPSYDVTSSDFREPELVADGPLPALHVPDGEPQRDIWISQETRTSWDVDASAWSGVENEVSGTWTSNVDWTTSYVSAAKKIPIDGRSDEEEERWWDPTIREKYMRPGPGILATLLERKLHEGGDHTLFSVLAKSPSPEARAEHARSGSGNSMSFSTSVPSATPSSATTQPTSPTSLHTSAPSSSQVFIPPPADEVRTAVPHPNAYYCRKHNGWLLVLWKSSSVLPPLASSFDERKLPDQMRRKQTNSCVGEGEQPFGQANKTHHFHHYSKAVDARKLDPPLIRQSWEKEELIKKNRRKVTRESLSLDLSDGIDPESMTSTSQMIQDEPEQMDEEPEEELLDLYVCCQCSFYCVVSDIIPGVIPVRAIEAFVQEKTQNPSPGVTAEMSVFYAWETIARVLNKRLWGGETRSLPIQGKSFSSRIGWSTPVQTIFSSLGWELKPLHKDGQDIQALWPPSLDSASLEGKTTRAKLLRARVEIGAWMTDFYRRLLSKSKEFVDDVITIDSAREMISSAIGSHPNQIPRESVGDQFMQLKSIQIAISTLGLTETSASVDYLAFAYMAQCRCDPSNTPAYFESIWTLVHTMQNFGDVPPVELQSLIMEERARHRFSSEDVSRHISALGFGENNVLGFDYDDSITDDVIEEAYSAAVRQAWQDPARGDERQRELDEALNVLAQIRGSLRLWNKWKIQAAGEGRMNPSKAYSTLDVPHGTEDELIISVFSLRVEDQPHQADKMREAVSVIADYTNSERLKRFLETGVDPGNIEPPVRADLPRGLHQLGNTCYLNSLLQYFYTIKDLREAVLQFAHDETKESLDYKLTEDDLKRHRVGGRLVTKREIIRSRKFVNLLGSLFWDLEYNEDPAVTPKVDLAKLALVTSKDEEEDEADRPATDSSNDTDATLVEDAPPRHLSPKPMSSPSSSSVLGKRPRSPRKNSAMEVDSPVEQAKDEGLAAHQSDEVTAGRSISDEQPEAGSSRLPAPAVKSGPEDVEMQDSTPNTKPSVRPKQSTQPGGMMFGRQHDVSECMDNCMFQIETALLRFDELTGGERDKTSLVKRLFYGKLKQRLTAIDDARSSRTSVHEKEDLFSHLPVNVSEEGYDIYDGLCGYFEDVVDFEGKKARMEVSLVDLPPILQIQLQRVQFNRETLQPYKSQAYLKFGEQLFLDRFLDRADPAMKAKSKAIQSKLNACRERINVLTKSKGAPYNVSLAATSDFLSKLVGVDIPEVDDDLITQLGAEEALLQDELTQLRDQVTRLKDELEEIWSDEKSVEYELTSVFVHSGSSPSWGHYFFYARNLPDRPDEWFKYNDQYVTEVSKEEVLADTTGLTSNPYLLVFARKGSDIVHTVNRFDPKHLPTADV